jgi:hypothetical protein
LGATSKKRRDSEIGRREGKREKERDTAGHRTSRRSDTSLSLSFHNTFFKGFNINWNEEFQRLIEMPESSEQMKLEKYEKLSALWTEFVHKAKSCKEKEIERYIGREREREREREQERDEESEKERKREMRRTTNLFCCYVALFSLPYPVSLFLQAARSSSLSSISSPVSEPSPHVQWAVPRAV